jgi:hypothetical protein
MAHTRPESSFWKASFRTGKATSTDTDEPPGRQTATELNPPLSSLSGANAVERGERGALLLIMGLPGSVPPDPTLSVKRLPSADGSPDGGNTGGATWCLEASTIEKRLAELAVLLSVEQQSSFAETVLAVRRLSLNSLSCRPCLLRLGLSLVLAHQFKPAVGWVCIMVHL